MELWIRSQDKEVLTEVTDLSIGGFNNNAIIGDHGCPLGTYKTKERALEVLDEIQELLNPLIKVKNEFKKSELTGNCNWEQDIEYINIPTKVYKMPQE